MRVVKSGSSEEEEETTDEIKERKRRIRALKLEREEVELRKTIEDLKPEKVIGNPGMDLVGYLVRQGLTPEKANQYIESLSEDAIAKIMMMSSRVGGDAFWPMFMMSVAPRGEKTTLTEMVDATKKLTEMATPSKPEGKTWAEDMAVKLVTETIPALQQQLSNTQAAAFQAQIDDLKGRVQTPEEYVKGVSEAAKGLGWQPPGSGASVNLEVEKMRTDLEKWKFDKEMEWKMKTMERADGQRKLKVLSKTAEKVATDVAKPIADAAARGIEYGMKVKAHEKREEGGEPPSGSSET